MPLRCNPNPYLSDHIGVLDAKRIFIDVDRASQHAVDTTVIYFLEKHI
jgi:hypothetical protein